MWYGNVNKNPTRCNSMQIFIYCKATLYVSGVTAPIIRSIARSESDGTRWRTGGEVKGKYANGVGSQQSCSVSEDGLSSITTADAHASAASSRLN